MLRRLLAWLERPAPREQRYVILPPRLTEPDRAMPDLRDGRSAVQWAQRLAARSPELPEGGISPVLSRFCNRLNDALGERRSHLLAPVVGRLVGTASDGRDGERREACEDWLVSEAAPLVLRAAGLAQEAERLERPEGGGALAAIAQSTWLQAWALAGDDREAAGAAIARSVAHREIAWEAAVAAARELTGWPQVEGGSSRRRAEVARRFAAARAEALAAASAAAVPPAVEACRRAALDARRSLRDLPAVAAEVAAGPAAAAAATELGLARGGAGDLADAVVRLRDPHRAALAQERAWDDAHPAPAGDVRARLYAGGAHAAFVAVSPAGTAAAGRCRDALDVIAAAARLALLRIPGGGEPLAHELSVAALRLLDRLARPQPAPLSACARDELARLLTGSTGALGAGQGRAASGRCG